MTIPRALATATIFLAFVSASLAREKQLQEPHEAETAFRKVDGYFENAGSSGVPAMHAALMPDGKVMFLDKVESYTELKLSNGQYAYSSIYDPSTKSIYPLSIITNAFCCGGAFLSDGRLITVGGNGGLEWLDPTVGNGFDAIRYFTPKHRSKVWLEPGNKLASNRWYASAQTMSDGTLFVASGSLNGLDPTNVSNNNPTYEILSPEGTTKGKNIEMEILVKNMPYFMYPFLHLLKDGSLFVFSAKSSQLFDPIRNRIVKELPDLPGLYRTYPNTGGSVMLPMMKENGYEQEIMICGGGAWQGIDSPCEASCGRIRPNSFKPEWNISNMPKPRGMVEAVLLLDGTVLWINGAQTGAQGFGIATDPAYEALIYDPKDNSWAVSGTSPIARLYHSVALLLLDGTVLIAGSNPNEMPVLLDQVDLTNQYKAFPTEFRSELFIPSYLTGDNITRRPLNIELSTKKIKAKAKTIVRLEFENNMSPKEVKVILYSGGFVTHAVHMGQVLIYLEMTSFKKVGENKYRVIARTPGSDVAIAPGPYVIYLVVDGVPGIGQFVMVDLD